MKTLFAIFALFFGFALSLAATHEESERDTHIGQNYGAPDPNNERCRLIDDFRYQPPTDPPTNHRWKIVVPGTGTVSSVFDNARQSYVMQAVSKPGQTLCIQYPDTGSFTSKKEYLGLLIKGNDFSIRVETVADSVGTQKTFFLLFMPIAGTDSLIGDTLRLHLGNGFSSGNWSHLNLALEDKLQSLKPNYRFAQFNRVTICGTSSVDDILAWERLLDIEGYASKTSVPQGGSIDLKISLTRPSIIPRTYRFEIYRAGKTLELKGGSPNRVGSYRTLPDSAYWYGAGWPTDATLDIPTDWPSGVYLVKLIPLFAPEGPGYSYIPFVVTEDQPSSTSNILFETAVNTYQAYNIWGGGSFYELMDSVISFDRPYVELYGSDFGQPGAGNFFWAEYPMIKWLENSGYTVEYCTNIDMHSKTYSDFLQKYKLFLSVGHDEYWSREARDKVEIDFRNEAIQAFDPPKKMAFFCANTCYWRVRFEQDPINFRKMTCMKYSDPNRVEFDLWRKPGGPNRPEAQMLGIQYKCCNVYGNKDTVKNTTHWIMQGTGLSMNEAFGDSIIGYEVDNKEADNIGFPPGVPAESVIVLAEAHHPDYYNQPNLSQATYYRYPPSGAAIFAAGTIQWSLGLDDPDPGGSKTARITKNVIDGFASTFRGHISQNITWAGKIYLGGDVTIDAGVTVTINPGTKIYFFPNNDVERTGGNSTKTELIVKGTLTCLGSQTDSIIFTSASTTPVKGDWGGVRVLFPGNANIDFTRFSYADTTLAVWGDTATVIVYNSTFEYFDKAAVFSKSAKTKLGGIFPLPNPPDCGKNNFLMNTATSGAKAVIKSAVPSGTIKAEGNWWTQTPPQSSWFSGNVDRTPYLLGYATSDSCGGNPGQSPPPGRVSTKQTVPVSFELGQNYPNPFNPTTIIEYALPEPAKTELKIYNILGQMVRKLVDEEKSAGYHQINWDGKDESGRSVSTGVYLYQIKAGDFVETKKMQLVK